MNYQITSDNIEVSPSMQTLARQKLAKIEEKLTSFPDSVKSVRVVMNSLKDDQFEAKIHLVIKGKEYFATENAYSLESALVAAVVVVTRELQTDKIITIEEDWKEAREAKRFDPTDTGKIEEEITF